MSGSGIGDFRVRILLLGAVAAALTALVVCKLYDEQIDRGGSRRGAGGSSPPTCACSPTTAAAA